MISPSELEQIKAMLMACSREQRFEILQYLRHEFPIHPLERELNTDAELILEAIARSSDLTLRGIRGVIAEAAFDLYVVKRLATMKNIAIPGNAPYDFLLEDQHGRVRVQVKMQRQKAHRPMLANEAYRSLSAEKYVVETQRTRGGMRDGADTRPYRFGDFDILAVSMQPATGEWSDFMYTLERWLLVREDDGSMLLKFQPVSKQPDEAWTDDILVAIDWLRSGIAKSIA